MQTWKRRQEESKYEAAGAHDNGHRSHLPQGMIVATRLTGTIARSHQRHGNVLVECSIIAAELHKLLEFAIKIIVPEDLWRQLADGLIETKSVYIT